METDEIARKFQEDLQAWVNQMRMEGKSVGMDELNNRIAQMAQAHNAQLRPDYNGFSWDQMNMLVNYTLQPGCPVQLRPLTEEQILEIPFMRQVLYLMYELTHRYIKLTARGYLPPKVVEELYYLGNGQCASLEYLEKMSESKVNDVNMLHITLEETALVKVSSGRMSLTEKGRTQLTRLNDLVRTIMTFLFKDINTGLWDAHEDLKIGNVGRLYSLWLLHHYGNEWHPYEFYADRYYKALPDLYHYDDDLVEMVYFLRVYRNLFKWLGFCELESKDAQMLIHKTPLIEKVFSFQEPAQI